MNSQKVPHHFRSTMSSLKVLHGKVKITKTESSLKLLITNKLMGLTKQGEIDQLPVFKQKVQSNRQTGATQSSQV